MRALYHSSAIRSDHQRQIQLLLDVMPGLSVSLIDVATAPDALNRYPVDRLPAFVFDPALTQTRNYGDLADLFDWRLPSGEAVDASVRGARAYSRPLAFGSQYHIRRERLKKRLDIFATPLSNESDALLATALDAVEALPAERRPIIVLHWISYALPNGQLSSRLGLGDLEESARRLAVARIAPDGLVGYLRSSRQTLGTSYWRETLDAAGLNPDAVRALARSPSVIEQMTEDAALAGQFAPGADFFILIENREVVESLNAALIEHIVGALAKSGANP